MTEMLQVSEVSFVDAGRQHRHRGLLGWISLTLGNRLRLDGLTLRQTAHGRLALSYPARRDSLGSDHPYVRPLNSDTRLEIEHQVFTALGLEGQ